jgi:hypothetical protein
MNLNYCTLTGVDQKTDLTRVAQLSAAYPHAEFAILFSPERSGHQNRFPTFEFVQSMLTAGRVRWAIHLCGRAVPDFIRAALSEAQTAEGEQAFRLATHTNVSRIQLNFAFRRAKFTIPELNKAIASLDIPVITQEHQANEGVSLALTAPNHQVLFDSSGGRGIAASKWVSPLEGKVCGFAGGLGPETLSTTLPSIKQVCAGQPFWIDMETRIRDENDWLDLDACERVLAITQSA